MTRPKIMITNFDKHGKVTDGAWHIRIGNRWRTFTAKSWATSGLKYINDQLKKAR